MSPRATVTPTGRLVRRYRLIRFGTAAPARVSFHLTERGAERTRDRWLQDHARRRAIAEQVAARLKKDGHLNDRGER